METVSVADNFTDWLNAHYESIFDDHEGPDFRCRRCGKQVNWVTKHAVAQHGDPITIMSVRNTRIGELIY